MKDLFGIKDGKRFMKARWIDIQDTMQLCDFIRNNITNIKERVLGEID